MSVERKLKLIECPRDAMQGWPDMIPASEKIKYINLLLEAGFDTIDFGSFVSHKAIPQMADTSQVIEKLEKNTDTRLLAIIANFRGAQDAIRFSKIDYLGFPFSISETFQHRNTNSSIAESFVTVQLIQQLCVEHKKELVIYFSMGFGNPYGDPYDESVIHKWAREMKNIGIGIISLADTVGLAEPHQVSKMVKSVIQEFPDIEIGVHLHSTPDGLKDKLLSAYEAGCRRFDSAVKGIGGCPMAGDQLVGNIDTERMIDLFESKGISTGINREKLTIASSYSNRIFTHHGI